MDHVQAGSLDPRPQSRSIISCREAHTKELRDERVHRDSVCSGSLLEPLVKFLVHTGDELFHSSMIASSTADAITRARCHWGKKVRERYGIDLEIPFSFAA